MNNNNSRLYNSGAYPIHSQQHDSFGPSLALSPRPSAPFDQTTTTTTTQSGALQQQQQPWFSSSIDGSSLSPTSPKLLTRDLMVYPSSSTTHTDPTYHTAEEDEAQQRQ
jgi:hypothetical protein